MENESFRQILRVGGILVVIGLLDVGAMIYCLINQRS